MKKTVGCIFLVLTLAFAIFSITKDIEKYDDNEGSHKKQPVVTIITPTITSAVIYEEIVTSTPTSVPEKGNFKLEIPSINLSWEVKNLNENEITDDAGGMSKEILDEWGVVRFADYSYPGEPGITALAGHRDVYGSPFLRLDKISVGDSIFITLNTGEILEYIVTDSIVVNSNDWSPLSDSDGQELRLMTCLIGSTKKRLFVLAERINY